MEWWENEREPKVVKAKWAENTSQKPLSDIFFSFLKSHQILRCSNEMRLFISGSATGTTSGSWTRLHRALEFAEAVQFAIEWPSPLGDNKRTGSATLTVAQRIGCQTPSMAVFPPLKRTLLDCRTSDLTKRTIFNPKVACCGQPIDQWGSATWRPSDCRNHKGSSISRVFPQFKFWISSWYYVQFGGRFCGLCYQFQVEVIGFDLFRIFAVFQLFFPLFFFFFFLFLFNWNQKRYSVVAMMMVWLSFFIDIRWPIRCWFNATTRKIATLPPSRLSFGQLFIIPNAIVNELVIR